MSIAERNKKNTLEVVTNVVIIVVAVIVGFVVVRNYFFTRRPYSLPQTGPKVGAKVASLNGVHWDAHRLTLLLALRKGCGFCESSVPFYQRLIQMQQSKNADLGVIAVFPDDAATVNRFVESEDLRVQTVSGFPLREMGVSGTPTLILVDQGGRVDGSWVGLLSPTKEMQVLKACGLVP